MVKRGLLAMFGVIMLSGLFSAFPLSSPSAQAAACKSENGLTLLSIKPWYSGVCKAGTDQVEIKKVPEDIIVIGLNLLSIAIGLAGYAAVGLVIWGGVKYVLSEGDSGKVAAAKKTIQNALIGLLIVLIAVTMVDFVTNLYA